MKSPVIGCATNGFSLQNKTKQMSNLQSDSYFRLICYSSLLFVLFVACLLPLFQLFVRLHIFLVHVYRFPHSSLAGQGGATEK